MNDSKALMIKEYEEVGVAALANLAP